MEAITYLDAFATARRDGQKLAKISQEKMLSLGGKYATFLKTLIKPVQQPTPVVAPIVSETPVQSAPVAEPVPVAPVQEAPSPVVQPVTPVKEINYAEVIDKFSMSVFDKSFEQKPLAGARKIRVNPKVTKHVVGLGRKFGLKTLADIVEQTTPAVAPIVEEKVSEPIVSTPVIETPVPVAAPTPVEPVSSVVEDSIVRDSSFPSVDDYLQKQKEIPNQESGIILQLSGDVDKLKAETVQKEAMLKELETKFSELQAQKAMRIKELQEEKLSYTATLDDLTERIRILQSNIAKEEQSLTNAKSM